MKKIDTIVVAPISIPWKGLAWVITVTPPWLWMEQDSGGGRPVQNFSGIYR